MKKLVFALLLAIVTICLVTPQLRAQASITIKDPAEFNSYQMATSQTDAHTKASQLEGFLTAYPQSVVKQAVLDMLLDTYQGLGDADKTLSAASRLLQMDPNNLKAIFISVYIKNGRCAKSVDQNTGLSTDAQTCDDSATLATKGLTATKPAGTSSDDWKTLTGAAFPIFHAAIALDDMVSKKDLKGAETEYKAELMLDTDDQSKSAGLPDTLKLATAYSQPGSAQDLIQAIWFYARVWDFAPTAPVNYKAEIEPQLERFYKKYHGGLDGLDAVKAQASATTFPPATFVIAPAPTPAEIVHKVVAETPDLTKLNLEDTEFILANGNKVDVDLLWAVLKDKATPVPGIVISATDSALKMAVTQDAKDAHIADFIVNMKKPLEEKEIPAAGAVFGDHSKGEAELDGVYDSYTQVPATATTAQTAEIVLREGTIVPKKTAVHRPPAHKAAAK
jgi:hypothetical protein